MSKLAISKETFIKTLNLIKEQQAIDDAVGDALETVCGGWVLFNSENKNLEAILMVMQEICNDVGDYIGWWLYESGEKIVYESCEDTTVEPTSWNVEDPGDLYDFILEHQTIWIKEMEATNNGK